MIDKKRKHFREEIRQKAHQQFKRNVRKNFHFHQLCQSTKYLLGVLVSQYTCQHINLQHFLDCVPSCFKNLQYEQNEVKWSIIQSQLALLGFFLVLQKQQFEEIIHFILTLVNNNPKGKCELINSFSGHFQQELLLYVLNLSSKNLVNSEKREYLQILQIIDEAGIKLAKEKFFISFDSIQMMCQGTKKSNFSQIVVFFGILMKISSHPTYQSKQVSDALTSLILNFKEDLLTVLANDVKIRSYIGQILGQCKINEEIFVLVGSILQQGDFNALLLLSKLVYRNDEISYEEIRPYLWKLYKNFWKNQKLNEQNQLNSMIFNLNHNIILNDKNDTKTIEQIIEDIGWQILRTATTNKPTFNDFQQLFRQLLWVKDESILIKLVQIGYPMILEKNMNRKIKKKICKLCEYYEIGNIERVSYWKQNDDSDDSEQDDFI